MALIGLLYSQDQFPEFPIYPDFLFIPETEETAVYTYQAEALALFARMEVQPDETQCFVLGIIAAVAWEVRDGFITGFSWKDLIAGAAGMVCGFLGGIVFLGRLWV